MSDEWCETCLKRDRKNCSMAGCDKNIAEREMNIDNLILWLIAVSVIGGALAVNKSWIALVPYSITLIIVFIIKRKTGGLT